MPNAALVFDFVDRALSDEDVRDLCLHHFQAVYGELSAGMSRKESIRRLVDH